MKKLFRHEFYKAFHSRTLWIVNLVFGALLLINLAAYASLNSLLGTEAELMGVVPFLEGRNAVNLLLGNVNLDIMIAIWVATIVVYDISKQTIKNTLMGGYSRLEVFFVKYIVTITMFTVSFVAFALVTLGVACASGGWGEPFTFLSLSRHFIEPFFLGLLLWFGFAGFTTLIAYWTRSTVLVVLVSVILTIIFAVVQMLYLFNGGAFYEVLLKLYYATALGSYMAAPGLTSLMYVLGSFLLFFLPIIGAYFIFRKAEIK